MSPEREPFVPSRPPSSLDDSPFARLGVAKPVNRYDYVVDACRGERVLDLGAYDETEVYRQGSSSYRWLHADIAAVADEVLGVDASEALRLVGEIETKQGTKIVYGLVEDLDDIISEFRPTVIVAGELIEHTGHVGLAQWGRRVRPRDTVPGNHTERNRNHQRDVGTPQPRAGTS